MFWFPSCLIMSTINLLESTAKQNHPMLNISQSLLIYRFFLWLFCYRHTGHLSLFCIFWTYPIASSCNCHVPLSPVSPCIRHVPLSPVFPENLDINLEIHVWFFFFFGKTSVWVVLYASYYIMSGNRMSGISLFVMLRLIHVSQCHRSNI